MFRSLEPRTGLYDELEHMHAKPSSHSRRILRVGELRTSARRLALAKLSEILERIATAENIIGQRPEVISKHWPTYRY